MKKHSFIHIFLFIAVAAALPSCMQEDAFDAPEFTESICFSAKMISGSGVTRSTVDCLELEDETWLVEASEIPGSTKAAPVTAMSGSVGITAIEYSGDWDETKVYPNTRMQNDEFTYDGGILTPVTPRAWRNIANDDKIRFFAYSPYLTEATGLSAMDSTVKGTPYVDYVVNATASNQTDLLFANSASNHSTDYDKTFRSTVPLEFKHALSAVQFKVGFDCTVTSLKLCNIVDKGRFQATVSGAWTKLAYSTAANEARPSFEVAFTGGVSKTAGQFVVDGDNTFMMIPQSFQSYTASGLDTLSKAAYLELQYTKTDSNSQVTSHTLRAPLGGASGSSWPMGHKLVYTIYEEAVPEVEYIYMDLAAGNIEIKPDSYTGYIFSTTTSASPSSTKAGGTTTKIDTISVSNVTTSDLKFYVYQSTEANRATTGRIDGAIVVPTYPEATLDNGQKWSDYITNNTDYDNVRKKWLDEVLKNTGRTACSNRIDIDGHVLFCDLTIDNIYTTHHSYPKEPRREAPICFNPVNCGVSEPQELVIRLKGDNRLPTLGYITNPYGGSIKDKILNKKLRITSFKGDNMLEGSLACISVGGENSTDSAIGGSNHWDANGIVIDGGTIFAGGPDDCTAIGGGSNGRGIVTINGGCVTAVSKTTGAAIGGGMGISLKGGDADITITGGSVYAYNLGNSHSVPATAIGGGSANSTNGNDETNITITGGYIYAQSASGVAIGGGSSNSSYGGQAKIDISGGTIIAKSVKYGTIAEGNGIGGGTGGSGGRGGNVTMTISGNPVITTGSIGGGKTRSSSHYIGTADVTITGSPVITGQFVMAAGAQTAPTFTMSGGTIKNSSTSDTEFVKIQENGGAVYMEDGSCIINGGTISGCTATMGGAIYMKKSGSTAPTFTMTGGMITGNTSTSDGGAVYVADGTVTMEGGTISNNLTIDGNGGGVCVQGGSFTMNGPESSTMIINNASHVDASKGGNGGDGGGIYVSSTTSDPDVEIIRGTVTGNAADQNGGGIGVYMAQTGNTHTAHIVIGDETYTTGTKSSPDISANSAALSGGGMYVEGSGSNVYIWSGTTKGNVSAYVTNEDIRNDGGLIYLSNDAVTKDKVNVQHVTITFHANNGSDPETTAVQHVVTSTNSLLTPPSEAKAFTRNYYTFKGWNTKRDGTGTHYEIDGYTSGTTTQATMNISSNLSLYAEWQAN